MPLEIQLIARCYEPCGFVFLRRHVAAVVFVVVNHVIIVIVIVVIQRYRYLYSSLFSSIAVIHHAVVVPSSTRYRNARTYDHILPPCFFLGDCRQLFFFFSDRWFSTSPSDVSLRVSMAMVSVVHHVESESMAVPRGVSSHLLAIVPFRQSFYIAYYSFPLPSLSVLSSFSFFKSPAISFVLLGFLVSPHSTRKTLLLLLCFLFFVARGYPPRRFRSNIRRRFVPILVVVVVIVVVVSCFPSRAPSRRGGAPLVAGFVVGGSHSSNYVFINFQLTYYLALLLSVPESFLSSFCLRKSSSGKTAAVFFSPSLLAFLSPLRVSQHRLDQRFHRLSSSLSVARVSNIRVVLHQLHRHPKLIRVLAFSIARSNRTNVVSPSRRRRPPPPPPPRLEQRRFRGPRRPDDHPKTSLPVVVHAHFLSSLFGRRVVVVVVVCF